MSGVTLKLFDNFLISIKERLANSEALTSRKNFDKFEKKDKRKK